MDMWQLLWHPRYPGPNRSWHLPAPIALEMGEIRHCNLTVHQQWTTWCLQRVDIWHCHLYPRWLLQHSRIQQAWHCCLPRWDCNGDQCIRPGSQGLHRRTWDPTVCSSNGKTTMSTWFSHHSLYHWISRLQLRSTAVCTYTHSGSWSTRPGCTGRCCHGISHVADDEPHVSRTTTPVFGPGSPWIPGKPTANPRFPGPSTMPPRFPAPTQMQKPKSGRPVQASHSTMPV